MTAHVIVPSVGVASEAPGWVLLATGYPVVGLLVLVAGLVITVAMAWMLSDAVQLPAAGRGLKEAGLSGDQVAKVLAAQRRGKGR